jgi:uncharacterized membrane protein
MEFWLLALSYWIHLLSTIVWLGGMALMAVVAWPALRKGTLADNQWFALQKQFMPWADVSLVLLLFTGFVQMTSDPNYNGFLAVDSVWAWAMLLKHIAFVGMVVITAYVQFVLYPSMDRLSLAAQKRPQLAASEQAKLNQREIRMLRLNLLCAALILLFTAVATAVQPSF